MSKYGSLYLFIYLFILSFLFIIVYLFFFFLFFVYLFIEPLYVQNLVYDLDYLCWFEVSYINDIIISNFQLIF